MDNQHLENISIDVDISTGMYLQSAIINIYAIIRAHTNRVKTSISD